MPRISPSRRYSARAPPAARPKAQPDTPSGAAGALEAVICALAIRHGLMPAGLNTMRVDPQLNLNYLCENRRDRVTRVLSNSFGFGGANCSLIFGRAG